MYKIIVVEDDSRLNQAVCKYLNDKGYEAIGVLNAEAAYDEMFNTKFDLIISDIMMPEIDGFEFAETIRENDKQTPILFMTAKDDMTSKSKGYLLSKSTCFLHNTPAYFNQHYGTDDEVYQFCRNAYMYFKDKEYSDTLHTIGIAPVAAPKELV